MVTDDLQHLRIGHIGQLINIAMLVAMRRYDRIGAGMHIQFDTEGKDVFLVSNSGERFVPSQSGLELISWGKPIPRVS